MSPWYKDRDFPEVKVSNADIVAHIPNPKQLARVIDEYNALISIIYEKDREITRLKEIADKYEDLCR